jgi:hypothetical protein
MALPSFRPRIALTGRTKFFFDRKHVKDALSDMEYRALMKSSVKIKDFAKRSIKQRGMARLSKKAALGVANGQTVSMLTRSGVIPERTRSLIVLELMFPHGSPAGTPPFSHTPTSGHQASYLSFKRNLWNFFDPSTRSAVVGPSAKGRALPFLHEFGGSVNLRTQAWIPRYGRSMRRPIIRTIGDIGPVRDTGRWNTISTETARYPARPYMRPALRKAIAGGHIAKAFAGSFTRARVSVAGMSAGG